MSLQTRITAEGIKSLRDTFALYAFEAFPTSYLIRFGGTKKWRGFFLTDVERETLLSTFYPVEVNTYKNHSRESAYGLLVGFTDGALSVIENRRLFGTEHIIEKYQKNSKKEGQRPCRICGQLFKPRKKTDMTCGKKTCINENKNRSKRKSFKDRSEYF
jgi:hypothetical protein